MRRTAPVALVLLFAAANARAHIHLDSPKSRYFVQGQAPAEIKQKAGPCGVTGDRRTTDPALITTYRPGQRITVTWRETVQHPGHYRIAFLENGQAFPNPTGIQTTPMAPVLLDGIADKSSASYSAEVTLPNVECDNCTLQLIQVMKTAPPYNTAPDGDVYYQCADLILKSDGAAGAGGQPSTAGAAGASGSGGAAAGGGGGGAAGGGAAGTLNASGASGSSGAPGSSGAAGSSAGATNVAGAGGTLGVAGAVSAAGVAGAQAPASAGTPGSTAGVSGAPAAAGSPATTAGTHGAHEPDSGDDEGGCAVGHRSASRGGAVAFGLALFAAALAARRRKRERLS